ncbi:MAG: family 1 glycosylhydrolase [Solobacterium sp.]|nr:family 1 glycosylhydrolase [Solobacterium sp.]
MDNWEWQSGYSMQFGLVSLDRENQTHTPKPSLAFLGSYAGK